MDVKEIFIACKQVFCCDEIQTMKGCLVGMYLSRYITGTFFLAAIFDHTSLAQPSGKHKNYMRNR